MQMAAEPTTTLGANVLRLREAAGMRQQDLAAAAGLTVSNVSQIEQGLIPDPRMNTLRRLATALGVTVDTLLEGLPDPPEKKRRPPKKPSEET